MGRNFIFFLFFAFFWETVVSKSLLDCDFSTDCCWATTREDEQWEIRSGDELNMNDFRKTFLVGKSRPPPHGNYAIRRENKRKSSLISCAVCTKTGQAVVKFRHWQSANAVLKICWQLEGDGSPELEHCQIARHSKQSKLNTYRLEDIPVEMNFRLVFLVENAMAHTEATILVDRITVDFEACESHEPTHSLVKKKVTPKPRQRASLTLEKLAEKDERIKQKMKQKEEQAYLKNVDQQIAKVVDAVNKKHSTSTVPTPTTPKPISVPPSPQTLKGGPVDPLTDLLGKDFVSFLDPNYESEDEEEDEGSEGTATTKNVPRSTTTAGTTTQKPVSAPKVSKIKTTETRIEPKPLESHLPIKPIVAQPETVLKLLPSGKPLAVQAQNGAFSLAAHVQHPIPFGVPSTCQTQGGCLFENGFCSWTTPPGSVNQFHLKKVHLSSFAETIVPPSQISVMETETQMNQAHTIVFDALEFTQGTRLIACCLANGQLVCPFSTPSEQTAVLWQFSKFECPVNTSKIAFICENFGTSEGICAVDNIRIHTSTDVFFLEPCQKDVLH